MKKILFILTTLLILLLPVWAGAANILGPNALDGFGTNWSVWDLANDPVICVVDTLDEDAVIADDTRNGVAVKTGGLKVLIDYDPGADTGKIILFEVSGIIEEPAETYYYVDEPYTWIAGQSAPAPGILLHNISLGICADHVVVQHLRSRGMDTLPTAASPQGGANNMHVKPKNDGETVNYVVIDHNSFSWNHDDMVGMNETPFFGAGSGTVEKVDFMNNLFAEGIRYAIPDNGVNKAKLFLGYTPHDMEEMSIIRNIFAHSDQRRPIMGSGEWAVINNLTYDIGDTTDYGLAISAINSAVDATVEGNFSTGISGGDSTKVMTFNPSYWYNNGTGSTLYAYDNRCDSGVQVDASDWALIAFTTRAPNITKATTRTTPFPTGLTTIASSVVEATVTATAGAWRTSRDSVDQRILNEIATNAGSVITAMPSLPTINEYTRNIGTGMPVSYNGWDIGNLPGTPHGAYDADYSNLGHWLHQLANAVQEETPPVGGGGSEYCSLTIQESQIPGTGNLTNYPVLLTAATFQSNCERCLDSDLANGAIKFYSDVGLTTQLNYEIVDFTQNADPASATAEIWVGIASLDKEANTTIYATWDTNNPAGESAVSNNATTVWTAHQAAWHLNETHSTNANHYKDATANVNHGQLTDANTSSAQGTGQIGKCIDFSGDADYINVGVGASLEMGLDDWSISGWVKMAAGDNSIMGKGGTAADVEGYGFWYYGSTSDDIKLYVSNGTSRLQLDSADTLGLDDSAFRFIAVTCDRSGNATFYSDSGGTFAADGTDDMSSFVAEDITNGGMSFKIGYFATFSATSIDELRVFKGVQTSDWLTASFNNQSAPATFVVDGDEVAGNPTILATGIATVSGAGVVTFDENPTETETAVGNPGWFWALKLSEQIGSTTSLEDLTFRWDSGPITASYCDSVFYDQLQDADGYYYLLFHPGLIAGHRVVNPQAYGTTADDFLIENGGTLQDGDGNALVLTYAVVDIDGTGTITIAVPYLSTSPKEFSSTSTLAAAQIAGFVAIGDDYLGITDAGGIGAADMSASDGTDGHPITLDGGGFEDNNSKTYGDYWVITRSIS